jgi:hypothetical protein
MLSLNGVFTLSNVPLGSKIEALAQTIYGYAAVSLFLFEYEANRLSCGIRNFNEALHEYSFLDNPDPDTPVALLTYYSTKLNHAFRRKVGCIVSYLFYRYLLFDNCFWYYNLLSILFWGLSTLFRCFFCSVPSFEADAKKSSRTKKLCKIKKSGTFHKK